MTQAMLDDLVDCFARLRSTFRKHYLEPPVAVQVDRETYNRLRATPGILAIVSFEAKDGFKMKIAEIVIERARIDGN